MTRAASSLIVVMSFAAAVQLAAQEAPAVKDLGGGAFTVEAPTATTPAATTGGATRSFDPATATAGLKGVVKFTGKAPKMRKIDTSSDPACAKIHGDAEMRSETVVVNDDGTLRNVFVWISKGLEGQTFPVPDQAVTLNQKGCRFEPHVLGVMAKQKVQVKNSDPTTHNIHALPKLNEAFNFSQAEQNSERIVEFARKEVMVFVKCDIHPWMAAYLGVVDHPFHGVTGDGGTFDLGQLPPGAYTVSAWHEKFGTETKTVTLTEGGTGSVEIVFTGEAKKPQ